MCGVYYLTDGLDVLYVGASHNVEERVVMWASKDIDFSQVFVDRCNPEDLDRLECEAIKRYDPPFNIVRGRGGETFQ
jgi:excinuclease UvrABC nuclease subunit